MNQICPKILGYSRCHEAAQSNGEGGIFDVLVLEMKRSNNDLCVSAWPQTSAHAWRIDLCPCAASVRGPRARSTRAETSRARTLLDHGL